jgi:dTDP-4-dehydrorhamnose reductase
MEKDTVLVFGGSGLVGSYLLPLLNSEFKSLYVSSHSTKPKFGNETRVDLSSSFLVKRTLEKIKPSIIVNLAAFTDVDGCEKNKEYALQLNARLPGIVSDYVKSGHGKTTGSYFLHISTDYVFDGESGNYVEQSQPNPVNWYGKTKSYGETEITTKVDVEQWCIARISTPFGLHPTKQSLPTYILNKVSRGESVQLIVDQYTSPIYSLELARILSELIERRINGVIHLAGRSRLSRFEQGMKVAEVFQLDKKLILRSSFAQMKWLALRPRDSSLNVRRALRLLRHKPRNYNEDIKDFSSEVFNEGH